MPSNLRPTTHECVHLVKCGHWSHDKDGGHTIRCTVAENPVLHANFLVQLYGQSKFYIVVIRIFSLFCSGDLDLDLMTFIYELDPYPLETYQMCQTTTKLSKVIILQPVNVCGSESSSERIGPGPIGQFTIGSENARHHLPGYETVHINTAPAAPSLNIKLHPGSLILLFIHASALSERDVVCREVEQLLMRGMH